MRALLIRSALRFYLRRPWQLVLALLGIGLGVAVYVGVDVANVSASRAFELSTAAVQGRTTHRLLPVGSAFLNESIYRELVVDAGLTAAPVVELEVALRARNGRRLTMLGIDPVEEAGFRDYSSYVAGDAADVLDLMTREDAVLLPEALARTLGLESGATIEINAGAGFRRVVVAGSVSGTGTTAESALPIVTDISTAQELSNSTGSLSRIDLRLSQAQAAALLDSLPPATTLVEAGQENSTFDEMSRAFAINLTALGLLALVVGMFLIYSTMSFSIVVRTRSMAILRAIGVSRRQLSESVLHEALLLGVAGTAIGLLLGHVLANTLVDMVLATINDFAFNRAVRDTEPPLWIYVRGALLGLTVTVIAGLGPLRDTARLTPDSAMQRVTLEKRTRIRIRMAVAASVAALLLAVVLFVFDERSLVVAFTGLFFVLIAGAAMTPAVTVVIARLAEPVARFFGSTTGQLAARAVPATLSRTAVAASALAVAVATVIGVGLMIGSFRTSLTAWIDTTLTADIYLSSQNDRPLDQALLEEITLADGIEGLSRSRALQLPTNQGTVAVRAFSAGPSGWGLDIVDGDGTETVEALETASAVAVSEPMAFRRELSPGDTLQLPTPDGIEDFVVAGVFRDYNTAGSGILMSLATYRSIWADESLTSAGIHFATDANRSEVENRVRDIVREYPGTGMRSSDAIRQISLLVFDRTFQITEVLRLLAAVVAFLGILSALLAISLERKREFSILRTLGFTPRQMRELLLTETGLLGLAAGIMAIPMGTVLALLLIKVINRRSFGWTMSFDFAMNPVLFGLLLAIAAALVAGIYPALAVARGSLSKGLRDE